jgi:outer membrane receptor for ferrienterochelin and colicin
MVDTAGYFQLNYTPTEKLKFVAGAQLNDPEGLSTDIVPRANIITHFTKKLGAKLLYGEAFRSGSAFETKFDNHRRQRRPRTGESRDDRATGLL